MQKELRTSKTFMSALSIAILLMIVDMDVNKAQLVPQASAQESSDSVVNVSASEDLLAIIPESSCEFKTTPEFQSKTPDVRPVVTTIAVSRDAQYVYAGGDDEYVYQIDRAQTESMPNKSVPELKAKRVFGKMNDWVRAAVVDPTSTKIAVMSQSGQLIVYDTQTGNVVNRSEEKIVGAHDLAYAPNGRVIAVCGYNAHVYMFDSQTLKPIVTWDAPSQSSTTVKFSNNGELFALGGRSGIVNVWATQDGSLFRQFNLKDEKSGINRRVRAVAFNEDDSLLAIAGDSQIVHVFDLRTGNEVASLKMSSGKAFSATFLGKNLLAVGNSQNIVSIWDVAKSKQICFGGYHTGTVASLLYVPQSESNPKPLLISSGFDAKVVVWNLDPIEKDLN